MIEPYTLTDKGLYFTPRCKIMVWYKPYWWKDEIKYQEINEANFNNTYCPYPLEQAPDYAIQGAIDWYSKEQVIDDGYEGEGGQVIESETVFPQRLDFVHILQAEKVRRITDNIVINEIPILKKT